MHKLTVTLKQHTPLIHFQHDQEGATLRASEVKPKLDRFIITKLGNGNYDAGKQWINDNHKEWWVGKGDHPALNYKMRIVAKNPRSIEMSVIAKQDHGRQVLDELNRKLYTTTNYPDNMNSLIMGNMGGRIKEDLLNFVMFENISLSFISDLKTLIEQIEQDVFDFFAETNFGNRTSKGFGCFTLTTINNVSTTKKLLADWYITFIITPDYQQTISHDKALKDIFIFINRIWKGLKKYSNAPKNQLKSVFLNIDSSLSNNDERIPSPIYFKPIVKIVSSNEWKVEILVFLNIDVISAAQSNVDSFYELLDSAVEYAKDNMKDEHKHTYYISNINIK